MLYLILVAFIVYVMPKFYTKDLSEGFLIPSFVPIYIVVVHAMWWKLLRAPWLIDAVVYDLLMFRVQK